MEISLEAIISLMGLLLGGGGGAFFTWRFMRRKAKAEADSAEVDTMKNMQEAYDKMCEQVNHYIEEANNKMDDVRSDRDRYKKERDELRDRFERLEDSLRKMRSEYQTEKAETDRKIAQLGRKVEAMRPFLCGDLTCKKRQLVALLDGEEDEKKTITRKGKVEIRTVRDLRQNTSPDTPPQKPLPDPLQRRGGCEDGGASDGDGYIEPMDMKDM